MSLRAYEPRPSWLSIACSTAALVVAAALCPTIYFYVAGNGLVAGAVALMSLLVLFAMIAFSVLRPSRRAAATIAGLIAAQVLYALFRVKSVAPDTGLSFCVDGECYTRPPVLSRLIREDETALAGVALSHELGYFYSNEERLAAVRSTRRVYRSLEKRRGGRPGLNGVLLASSEKRVAELLYLPPGTEKVPALIVLHGFGGLMTPIATTLVDSELGQSFAMVFPALDLSGAWWRPEGRAVLQRTIQTLPPRIDRANLWLVGISNGAIGATHLAFDSEVGQGFRGAVLVVGGDDLSDEEHGETDILMIPARADARFPLEGLEAAADVYRAAGANVTIAPLDGDHFLLFDTPGAVTNTMASWLRARSPTRGEYERP